MDHTMTPEEMAAGRAALMGGNVGGSYDLLVKEAHGSTIVDMNGREYLDCTSQAWSMNIGFSHPKVIAAVQEQVTHYMHIRTSFETIPKLMLSKRLAEMAPGKLKKVSYCLHGGNALLTSQAACRSALYSGNGKRAASRLPSVRQYAGEAVAGAMPSALIAAMRSSTARTWLSPSTCSSRRALG